jgi:nucleotide-binding universal stress UspA family protein
MTEIRTILFATDFSPESEVAFAHASVLAAGLRARVTLFHALEPHGRYAPASGTDAESLARAEEAARVRLRALAAKLTVPHEVVVQGGLTGGHVLVDLAVLDMIHRTRPDLTVIAARGRKGFTSSFLGSVADEVIQHAGRPVLCVRETAHASALPYRRLIVATDLSVPSRRAFPLAALLARTFDAGVTAVHVHPGSTLAALAGLPGARVPAAPAEDDLIRFLEPDLGGVQLEAAVSTGGSAWHRIVKTAEEKEADLIVMATQGLDTISDKIIGSHTERVVRHAPCPVLVA